MQKRQAKSTKGVATQKAERKQPYRDAGVAYKNLPDRPGNSEKGS